VTTRKEKKLLQVGHSIMAGGDAHKRLWSHYTVGDEERKTVSHNCFYKILLLHVSAFVESHHQAMQNYTK
jgi:hypothetical protein